MASFRRALLLSAAATALVAPNVFAQQQECDIEVTKPGQLMKAFFALQGAQQADSASRPKKLQAVIGALDDHPEKINNPLGRDLLLGETLTFWLEQPGMVTNTAVRRADLGFKTNPEATIDPVLALDSAFKRIEAAKPTCVSETEKWRRQQPWLTLTNLAISALNENKLDSAAYFANRANTIFAGAPYTWQVLAAVSQKSGKLPESLEYLRKGVVTTKGDTSLAETRRQLLLNVAMISASQVQTPEQKDQAQQAIADLNAYIAEAGDDPNAASAKAELARLHSVMGDTAAVAALYKGMLENPAQYSDVDLFQAGLQAAQAEHDADAEKLFKAGLEKNPNSRDGLYNLVAVLFNQKKFTEMLPVAKKLVAVDPNNPENWRLLAAAWQGVSKDTKSAAVKRAQTDSLVQAFEKYQKLPTVVTFSQFRHDGATHTLKGVVENRGAKATTATIRFEFLDAQGNVVATKEATVGPVAPKAKADFTVTVEQPGIAAFRYAPIA